MRVVLLHFDGQFELTVGTNVVGRDEGCSIEIADDTISRRHAQLELRGVRLEVVDLGSTNGTRLNGRTVRHSTAVSDADVLELGKRCFRVQFHPGEPPPAKTSPLWPIRRSRTPTEPTQKPLSPSQGNEAATWKSCGECWEEVPLHVAVCPTCGTQLDFPSTVPDREERRKTARIPIDIKAVYTSATLCFSSRARDLGAGGVFIQAERFDPLVTRCMVTLIPDGLPPLTTIGEVRHVRAETHLDAPHTGIGIRFTGLPETAARWLETQLVQR